MRRIRKTLVAMGLAGALVLSLNTAAWAATCGGPWTGPIGATCTFNATGGPLTFGGFAVAGGTAAIGMNVFSPPGVYVGGCSNTAPGFAACGTTSITIPPGQTVICVVKGLQNGFYTCSA